VAVSVAVLWKNHGRRSPPCASGNPIFFTALSVPFIDATGSTTPLETMILKGVPLAEATETISCYTWIIESAPGAAWSLHAAYSSVYCG